MNTTFQRLVLLAGLLGILLFGGSASAQNYGEVDKVLPAMDFSGNVTS